jgi:hypothetical protein
MISGILHNKLVVIIIILLVIGGAWYALAGGGESDTSSSSSSPLTSTKATTRDDAALIATLTSLRAIKLEGTIFSNPAFIGLRDYTTAIIPEPVGRADPFAALPGGGTSASTDTGQSARIFQPAP